MSRPRGDHAGRRDEIADAACEVIVAGGLHTVTLQEVGRRLGVTTGVLTHYFKGKQDLLQHAKERQFDLVFARALEAASRANGIERIHAVVQELLPTDRRRRTPWQLLVAFYGEAIGVPALLEAQDQRMQRWWTLFRDEIASLQRDGALPARTDPERDGIALAAFMHGLAIHMVVSSSVPRAAWARDFAREYVELLLLGRAQRLRHHPRTLRMARS